MHTSSTRPLHETATQLPDCFSLDTHDASLTPSAVIRNHYYRTQRQCEEDDTTPDRVLLSHGIRSASPASSLNSDNGSVGSLCTERDDSHSVTSVRTTDGGTLTHDVGVIRSSASTKTVTLGRKLLGRSGTIFRSKTGAEPKIVVQQENADTASLVTTGSSLLSRLSKTAAPMRARLSAMSSRSSRHLEQLRHLRTESSVSLSLPVRRSAESVFNIPVSRTQRPRANGERSQSFSFGNDSAVSSLQHERMPVVYPALLSRVAVAFKESITLETKTKDNIKYMDAFDGREAVDKLANLLKTTDRNLALLLGRALDAQKLFHDVNYEHRLRDSVHELYQLRQSINVRSQPDDQEFDDDDDIATAATTPFDDEDRSDVTFALDRPPNDDIGHVNGVFTILTDCYSPTCTREKLCYSMFCPRRLEQRVRAYTLNNRGQHMRTSSRSSLLIDVDERLWIHTVSKEVADKLSKEERRRQETIYELVYTEKDFVDDLVYLKESWITPLSEGDVVDQAFVNTLFWNIMDIHDVNAKLTTALLKRQNEAPVVDAIGDILLEHVVHFEPFVQYGAHQIISKNALETEKTTNPLFARFVQETERLPESRKLEVNGFLTKPTTRLGRYNLLLREILKHTPKDHPDQTTLPEVMSIIKDFLGKVNQKTGEAENRFNLEVLDQRLMIKEVWLPLSNPPSSAPQTPQTTQLPRSSVRELDLLCSHRQLIMKGSLKKKGSGSSESSSMLVFLLDHCLLITKHKFMHNEERYKLYRKPIPLALIAVTLPDQNPKRTGPYSRTSTSSFYQSDLSTPILSFSSKSGYPITFAHLGNGGFSITLYAASAAVRRQWVESIETQRTALMEKQKVFDVVPISEKFFNAGNRVTCSATFDNGQSVILGSDQGVYLKNKEEFIRILAVDKVSQIDVLEGPRLFLVLADKTLYKYSLDTLLSSDSVKRGRRISSPVSFFKVGNVFDKSEDEDRSSEKQLVCYVRCNAITSNIWALLAVEPFESSEAKKKHDHIRRFIRGKNEPLKLYKELYIPGEASSIQYFKNSICVGCAKGFQMVNIGSARVQSVLDPRDENNAMLVGRENMKPVSMFRHPDGNILLCYTEMAFYIDKKGKRARVGWTITWEGQPTAFVFRFPYIVAFNTHFIEVRHIDTGDLVQVIPGTNIRCLRPDSTDSIHAVMDDRTVSSEAVFELKQI